MKHLLACLAILAAFNVTAQVDGFQLPYNPDSEPDGYIGVGDILEVLSIFGSQFSPDDIYTNDDSTHIVMNVGSMTYPECEYTCQFTLPGSWRVATMADAGGAWPSIKNDGAWLNQVSSAIGLEDYGAIKRWQWNNTGTVAAVTDFDVVKSCYCATQERPKVEYSYCEGSNIQNCANNKVADGWYPFSGMTSHHRMPGNGSGVADDLGYQWKVQAFWRWAD